MISQNFRMSFSVTGIIAKRNQKERERKKEKNENKNRINHCIALEMAHVTWNRRVHVCFISFSF